ncbi:DUF6707 family protein [Aquimarina muelleri]|uniref:DUF6707 family protein n=1 Tax=Aquimarina muelleri TaxID=279356 RepID=UPI003F682F97
MQQILELNSNSASDIYDFSIKVFEEFVHGNHNEIKNSLNEIENLEFIDYNTWTWIEPLISLKSRLHSNDEVVKGTCKNKILSVLEKGNSIQTKIKKKVFNRVLNGEEQFDQLIEQYHKEGETDLEKETVYKAIMQLVTIIEMGASEKFTVEDAEQKLTKMLEKAKSLS